MEATYLLAIKGYNRKTWILIYHLMIWHRKNETTKHNTRAAQAMIKLKIV